MPSWRVPRRPPSSKLAPWAQDLLLSLTCRPPKRQTKRVGTKNDIALLWRSRVHERERGLRLPESGRLPLLLTAPNTPPAPHPLAVREAMRGGASGCVSARDAVGLSMFVACVSTKQGRQNKQKGFCAFCAPSSVGVCEARGLYMCVCGQVCRRGLSSAVSQEERFAARQSCRFALSEEEKTLSPGKSPLSFLSLCCNDADSKHTKHRFHLQTADHRRAPKEGKLPVSSPLCPPTLRPPKRRPWGR